MRISDRSRRCCCRPPRSPRSNHRRRGANDPQGKRARAYHRAVQLSVFKAASRPQRHRARRGLWRVRPAYRRRSQTLCAASAARKAVRLALSRSRRAVHSDRGTVEAGRCFQEADAGFRQCHQHRVLAAGAEQAAGSTVGRIDAHHGARCRRDVARWRHACACVDTQARRRPELRPLPRTRKSGRHRRAQRECIRQQVMLRGRIFARVPSGTAPIPRAMQIVH